MAIRKDNSTSLKINIDNINDKYKLRTYILEQWIKELPNSKYRYFVEELTNKNRIYIERPGRLNKGCDFIIYIENYIKYKNGNDKPPKHNFIIEDLKDKKKQLKQCEWLLLLQAIESIYKCDPFNVALTHCNQLPVVGEDYELILKALRWFFIEQDITYWLGQGRDMLYNVIKKI